MEACWEDLACAFIGLVSTTQIVTPARLAIPTMDCTVSPMSEFVFMISEK